MKRTPLTGHKALVQELHSRDFNLLDLLADCHYSSSRYYRRLDPTGEPPADVVVMIADEAGLSRRHLLEVSRVISKFPPAGRSCSR